MSRRVISWKLILLSVAVLTVAMLGLMWLWAHDFDVVRSIDEGINLLRDAGPFAFFGAMAILPAIGCPLLAFHLTAASAFAAQLGLGGVLAAAGAALAVNLALTYWLACYGIRPWLERLIARTRYKIPQLDTADHVEITLVVRITPGPPFFVQGYLLGLAGVKFGTYMLISWLVAMAYAVGFIIFGEAILHGKAGKAIIGLSVIIAVALVFHLFRRHYGKKHP
ncbi:MAG: hypothetical protein PHQ04_07715 [Opitutaceae bacterium]|nr:hypothetical protein [Opitutaceae bacterium]